MSREPERRIGFDSPGDARATVGRYIDSHMRMRRAISGLLDHVLVGMPAVIVQYIVLTVYEWRGHGTPAEGYRAIFDNPLWTGIILLLFMLKDTFHSPGKRIMRLKLVAADGSKPPFWKRVLRNVTVIVAHIEALVIIFSGRRVTDWILKLNVIDAEEE